jgi:hypothetical protein
VSLREPLALTALALLPFALVGVVGGCVCLFLAEHSPADASARARIEGARDRHGHYYPPAALLTARGRRLRRRGAGLLGAGVGVLALAGLALAAARP